MGFNAAATTTTTTHSISNDSSAIINNSNKNISIAITITFTAVTANKWISNIFVASTAAYFRNLCFSGHFKQTHEFYSHWRKPRKIFKNFCP